MAKNDSTILRMGLQIGFIVAAAGGVYCFVSAAQQDVRRTSCSAMCKLAPAYAGRDRTAPDFELPDMNGKPVKLSSFRGKTVFLNFWTKTCGPCLEEMPSLGELAKIVGSRSDMVLLTVSTDEGPDDVRDTLKVALGSEPTFPVLFDPDGKIVREKYGTKLFPETWIIDPQGVVRARFDGARDWSTAISIEIGNMVQKGSGCPVEFAKGRPEGQFAGLCDDES